MHYASIGDSFTEGVGDELPYHREHVIPWVGRRLRGRSSGDDRGAKHATWVSVPSSAAART